MAARQREGLAEGQLRCREALVGRKPMAKRCPDQQEPHEANARGAPAARLKRGRRTGKGCRNPQKCVQDVNNSEGPRVVVGLYWEL